MVGGEWQAVGSPAQAVQGQPRAPLSPLSPLVQISNYLSCSCKLGLPWENYAQQPLSKQKPPG